MSAVVPSTMKITFARDLGSHKENEQGGVTFIRAVTGAEAKALCAKDEDTGACVRSGGGFKS